MNPATNLVLVGPMGAGKTTLGRRLARHFGLEFLDLDEEIERRTGAPVTLIFDLEGELGFRARESALLAEVLSEDGRAVATGGGSVLASENRERMRARGFVVYLPASVSQQLERLRRDRKRPLLAAPDRQAKLVELAATRDPLYRDVADLVLPAEGASVERAARRAAEAIERLWQRGTAATSAA